MSKGEPTNLHTGGTISTGGGQDHFLAFQSEEEGARTQEAGSRPLLMFRGAEQEYKWEDHILPG